MIFRKTISVLLLVFLLFNLPSSNLWAEEYKDQGFILVIHSYSKGYKWTDDISRGFLDGIKLINNNYKISFEFLDTKKFFDREYLNHVEHVLLYKYKNNRPDCIVAVDNNALKFVKEFRRKIDPQIPIFFCGINNFSPKFIENEKAITGVVEKIEPLATFRLMKRINPQMERIIVIIDGTETGMSVIKEIKTEIKDTEFENNVIFWNNLSFKEITSKIKSIDKNTEVFYTFYFRDGSGEKFENFYVVKELTGISNKPFWGAWDFNLGLGIAGGKLASGYFQGETVSTLVKKLLSGKNINEIKIITNSPNKFMFDYNVLNKYNIPINLLPRNSIIINKPVTFYEKNKILVWSVGIIVLILILLVFLLVYISYQEKKAKLLINESEDKLSSVFDSTNQFIALLHLDGKVEKVNKSALKFLDLSESSIKGEYLWNTPWMNHSDELKDFVIQSVIEAREGKLIRKEIIHYDFKNRKRIIDFILRPFYDEENKPVWLIAQGYDITELKDYQNRLKSITEELKTKNDELEQIVHATSHDLRNPLVNIQGFTKELYLSVEDLFDEIKQQTDSNTIGELKDDIKNSIDYLNANVNRMEILVSGLLEFSRISNTEPEITEVDLNKTFKSFLKSYEKTLELKGIEVNVSQLHTVLGDQFQIRSIFLNIFDNAIKYSKPEGKSKIQVWSSKSKNTVKVFIKDNGIGIDKKYQKNIFKIFNKLNPRDFKGEGLGLALVSRWVKKNNGNIYVESELGEGSTFIVELPAPII